MGHANATEHLMELTSPCQLLRNDKLASSFIAPAKQTLLGHELVLNDFYDALKFATKEGNIQEIRGIFNGWEIEIRSSKIPNGLPVIVHALKK